MGFPKGQPASAEDFLRSRRCDILKLGCRSAALKPELNALRGYSLVEKEIIFLVDEAPEGGYTARTLGHSVFTEAESLEDIKNTYCIFWKFLAGIGLPWYYGGNGSASYKKCGGCRLPERSRDWINQAKRDLASAEAMLTSGFYEWACFASQQAAEKAVKAVFQKMGATAWGHSLLELLKLLAGKVTISEELFDYARTLDRFYIPARYPNGFESGSPFEYFTKKDAEYAIFCGRRIVEFCTGLLASTGKTD